MKLLDPKEAAQEIGMSVWFIYERTRPDCPEHLRIPHRRFGNKIKLVDVELKEWALKGDGKPAQNGRHRQ